MKNTLTDIEEFIKENYEPVENKPGYVWLSKRNLRIIKIETLVESFKTYYLIKLVESFKTYYLIKSEG